MKRQDAFHKLRTICQRLDELDSDEFKIQPLRLYLFGSVLTNKPNPNNIDTVLTYEYLPDFDYDAVPVELAYSRPTALDRLVSKLRQGMQKVRISLAGSLLDNWAESAILIFTTTRLIWEPDGDWQATLAKVEAEPLTWVQPHSSETRPSLKTLLEAIPEAEFKARRSRVIAELEAQNL